MINKLKRLKVRYSDPANQYVVPSSCVDMNVDGMNGEEWGWMGVLGENVK